MASTANTILIRGLDKHLYRRLVGKAKEDDKNVAELVNDALRGYMGQIETESALDTDPRRISILSGSVVLSKSDIMGIYHEVGSFHIDNSGELTFDKDVDKEAFGCIERIRNTGRLKVPKDVHHFVLLKSGRVNGTIEKY
jgi:hypothetical protein